MNAASGSTRDAASHNAGVYGLLLLQSFIASGTHIVAKVVVNDVDAFTLTFVRSLIAAFTMGSILLLRRRWPRIDRDDLRMILTLSVLAVPINQFFFLFGMRYTIPSNAALLYATTPIIVLLLSTRSIGERLTSAKVLGVALGFIGVTIVIFERGVDASLQYVFGNVIIMCAVLAWGLYTVYGKKLIAKYGAMEASSMTLIIGTIIFIPIGIIPASSFPFTSLTSANWLQILYLGIVTSVFSYFLWYHSLARIEAGKAALFANLQPILTTLLAVLLLGQTVTLAFIIGGTVALCGVIIAQFG